MIEILRKKMGSNESSQSTKDSIRSQITQKNTSRQMETIREASCEDFVESDTDSLSLTSKLAEVAKATVSQESAAVANAAAIEIKDEEGGNVETKELPQLLGSAKKRPAMLIQESAAFEGISCKGKIAQRLSNEVLKKGSSSAELMKLLVCAIDSVETELGSNVDEFGKKFVAVSEELVRCKQEVILNCY